MSTLDNILKPTARIRSIRSGGPNASGVCVVYWMQRSQRAAENPALDLAISLGNTLGLPVLTVFGLTAEYPGAQRRQYRFLLDAMPEIRDQLKARGVPFVLRLGSPDEVVVRLCDEVKPAILIGDENPVKIGRKWRNEVAERVRVPFQCVDGDVVVPTAHFPKQEYAARTIRPKIHRVWDEYIRPFGQPVVAETSWRGRALPKGEKIDPQGLIKAMKVSGIGEVPDYRGGLQEASRRLDRFVNDRLPSYATDRNEPTPYMTSELSAHLHFGHISPITCALAARESGAGKENVDAYLEELIVRRELAINFVTHNDDYDRLRGCPTWAQKTLAEHASDRRTHRYTAEELELGKTHDPLWNASQIEMVVTGRMHNYLRMYWAKKILEWSDDAETAFNITLDLNDRYEMDGRDPNGYVGVSWAIGGTHDRPWPERPIFGKIRFMSYESTRKKFDSKGYIRRSELLAQDAGLND